MCFFPLQKITTDSTALHRFRKPGQAPRDTKDNTPMGSMGKLKKWVESRVTTDDEKGERTCRKIRKGT